MSYFSAQQYMNFLNSPGREYDRQAVRAANAGQPGSINRYSYGAVAQRQRDQWSSAPVTLDEAGIYLTHIKQVIVNRDWNNPINNYESLGKWHRPWDVVPELRDFQAPAGDWGVGIEVEMGFTTEAAAQSVARYIEDADWQYVTLDREGGRHPIEATFPPVYLSTIHDSDVVKYLDYLATVPQLIVSHNSEAMVGTHVNVSPGAGMTLYTERVDELCDILENGYLGRDNEVKYFGRRPYGFAYGQGWSGNGYKWVEYKLFNSQTDSRRLRQYINEAVAMTKLCCDPDRPMNSMELHLALEEAYHLPTEPVAGEYNTALAA